MDLWQMVLADHANIEELCREILRATDSGPNSRSHLFSELDREMERHIRAKESVLYPALAHDDRTGSYLSDLGREQEDIRQRLDDLADDPDKDSRDWALNFKELVSAIRHYFTLEQNGVLMVARSTIEPQEAEALRRAYERAKIASLEARRWHMPESVMPSRYGLSTGSVFGVLAGVAALGAAALLWRGRTQSRQNRPLQPVRSQPAAPFPLRSRVVNLGQGRSGMAPAMGRGSDLEGDLGDDAMLHGAGSRDQAGGSDENWFSSANPPRAPSGLSTPLQPGGLAPGGGPGASVGSIGTGGGQTTNRDTGSLKRDGQ